MPRIRVLGETRELHMRIGIMIGSDRKPYTVDQIINFVVAAEEAGLDSAWMANIFGFDAIMTMTLAARATRTIKVGTAVTPTYPRHPAAIAQQALTAAAATDNRFVLGIGLSHQRVIEGVYGMSYAQPAKHMREYLEIVMPLVHHEQVNVADITITIGVALLVLDGIRTKPPESEGEGEAAAADSKKAAPGA